MPVNILCTCARQAFAGHQLQIVATLDLGQLSGPRWVVSRRVFCVLVVLLLVETYVCIMIVLFG